MHASAVWDPYYIKDIQQLEKVRRAARWVLNDYSYNYELSDVDVTTLTAILH